MMIRTTSVALLLLIVAPAVADEPKPPMLTPEEQKLWFEAAKLAGEAYRLNQQGKPADAVAKLQQMLEIHQRLYPSSKYPEGHSDLARSLHNLGFMLLAMGQAEKALPFYQQSLDMTKKLFPASRYPGGHPDLARSLHSLGYVLQEMGQAEKAVTFYQQSLELRQKLYPVEEHPNGHPELAISLNSVGGVLNEMGQSEKALPFYRQGLDMTKKLFPASRYLDGHLGLTSSLNNLGIVLQRMGQAEKALPFALQGLEMKQKLFPAARYPDGHPELATSLNNLGFVLQAMGQAEKALHYYQQCLDMRKKLFPVARYPDGHPQLATSFNNLAGVLQAMGQVEKALSFYQQSLDMRHKLFPAARYPDGHPDLANSLNNLGFVLQAMGQVDEALLSYQQCLDMRKKLFPVARYPDGHPQLASSLNNLGSVLQAMGQAELALPFYRQSLEMQQRLLRRELATASEEAAFDKIDAQPLFRESYLSVTRGLDTSAAESLRLLWPARSMVTRLLEQRQANARAAGTELGAQLDHLRGLRRRTDQLLQDTKMKPADRDQLLVTVANERDQLERDLVDKIPALKRWKELDKLGPDDLALALPPGAVFVDVIRYTRFEYVDKKQKRTPSYVAFVVATEGIRRIELQEADPIDTAVRQWRAAIDQRGEAPAAVAVLTRRVWEPLAKQLPPRTQTIYLASDGDLARLPWAALPTGKDRVLLEDLAVAQVPHGTFLLDQLKFGKKPESGDLVLTVGGVEYGMGIWPALPGTVAEAKAITAVATGPRESLNGKDASVEKFQARLPHARYVHLATHGEFKADALSAERRRAAKAVESRVLGDDTRNVAAKNPLGYVGLVLADGKILSGMGIVDLPLEQLNLVTLSACETGLGELTGGEGVQGLQRAFHLAGCPNVIASLWKVNDAATAALMAKFYHELWVNKKPPIEALRTAQLTIYHHPELIPALAGERGAPKLKEALAARPGEPRASATGENRTPTKLWAAFVLSGVGK